MADASSPPPLPKRTLLQRWHRLRTSPRFPYLLFFGLLVAGGLSQVYCYWWGVRVEQMLVRHKGYAERFAIFPQWTRTNFGAKYIKPLEPIHRVRFSPEMSLTQAPTANDLRWLRGSLYLRELHLTGRLSSEACQQLGCLTQLKTVYLWAPSDGALEALERLPALTTLTLPFDESIDPAIYQRVARMPRLERLNFWMTENTRGRPSVVSALQNLAASQSLRRLEGRLNGDEQLLVLTTPLPDGSPPLPELRELRLRGSGWLTDRGLVNLGSLPSLIHLDVMNSQITDQGLAQLKGLPFLRTLYVEACPRITDEGAAILASMHKLESLNVLRTNITKDGVLRLAALPRLRCLRQSYREQEMLAKLRQTLPAGCKLYTD